MNMHRIFLVAFLPFISIGCHPAPSLYVDAKGLAAEVCTNEVIGFRRIVNPPLILFNGGADPTNWTAEADVEYINKQGGVEVTNLPIMFWMTAGKLYAATDMRVVFERGHQEFLKEMERLRSNRN